VDFKSPSYFVYAAFMLSHFNYSKKSRGKYTGFPHTASLKNALHTLHINQTSVLTKVIKMAPLPKLTIIISMGALRRSLKD